MKMGMRTTTDQLKRAILAPRVAAAILCLLCLLSCRHDPSADEIGKRWIKALNMHDTQEVMAMLDAQAEYSDPVVSKPLNSAEFKARLVLDWSNWKDRRYIPSRIDTIGASVVIEWHIEQTHPTGKPVPLDGLTILQLADGKVHRVREYYDAAVYLPFLKPPSQ